MKTQCLLEVGDENFMFEATPTAAAWELGRKLGVRCEFNTDGSWSAAMPVLLHPGLGSRPGKRQKTAASCHVVALLATVHDLTMPMLSDDFNCG